MTTENQRKIDIDPTRMYTTGELAFHLNVSSNYIRDLVRNGHIAATKPFGGQWRIAGAEVQHHIDRANRGESVGAQPEDDGDVDEVLVSPESAARVFNTPLEDAEPAKEEEDADDGDGGAFRHLGVGR